MAKSWLSNRGADPLFSVVLPVYNAASILAEHLPDLLDYLEGLGSNFEVLVCDDGSDELEATRQVAERLGVRYLRHEKNRGKGAAVRLGMLKATGRYRMFTDVDIPFAFETIERALYAMIVEEADVVFGDRKLPGARYFEEIGQTRRLASDVFSKIAGAILGTERFDTQCGFKALRGGVAEDVFSRTRIDRFAMDVEIVRIALDSGYRIAQLPVVLESQGRSSVHLVRDSFAMLLDLLRIQLLASGGSYLTSSSRDDDSAIFVSGAIPDSIDIG